VRRYRLTAAAVAVACVAAVAQYAVPAAIPALQRDPGALRHGEWWRLVSPLLVQTLGWYQVLANLVTLAVIGAAAEPVLGRWRWVLAFLAGTAGGQVAAYLWHEGGGGDSIAICGLAAAVALATPSRAVSALVVAYVGALTGWGLWGVAAAGLACVAGAVLGYAVPRLSLVGTVGCALVLLAARDLHGAALTAGLVAAGGLEFGACRRSLLPRSRRARSPG
jgi:membrane associated rhomboid family serine protease